MYKDIINLLKHRKVANVEILSPLYICSIGAHIFNLANKKTKIFTDGALVSDSRLHVIMVTVPGFGKSFMLKQFLDKDIGICGHTDIHPKWAASMTTASFTGTIHSDKEGNPISHKGICEMYSKSIIGIHEFAGITQSMTLHHNAELEDVLLMALDDGMIRKNVVSGEIDYTTSLTLFSAVQPARYNLTSGLGRRICFLVHIPTYGDIENLRHARREARKAKDNTELLSQIRDGINKKLRDVYNIQNVSFDSTIYDYLEQNHVIPYEEILYERIALGYHIMNHNITESITVTLDEELTRIFDIQIQDRRAIKEGVDNIQVWRFISGLDSIRKQDLYDALLEFSLDKKQIDAKIRYLVAFKFIKLEGDQYIISKEKKEL